MSGDVRSVANMIGEFKLIVFYTLGYLSCVGVFYSLCQHISRNLCVKRYATESNLVLFGEYALSLVAGSGVWYALLMHPALLWIAISLFLVLVL